MSKNIFISLLSLFVFADSAGKKNGSYDEADFELVFMAIPNKSLSADTAQMLTGGVFM